MRELEEELAREKRGRGAARARIDTMSPEVTDSNPYRCAEPRRGLCQAAEDGEEGEPWAGTVGLGEVGEAHGAGGASDGWESQGWRWLCWGGCRAVQEAGAPCGEERDALGYPIWLGWQGWMSGLLCIILLYNTGRGGERGNLVSFSARLLVDGTGVGIT